LRGSLPETQFITALLNDFIQHLPQINNRPINSIFIGGGTPSLISSNGIIHLLTNIQSQCSFQPNIEITIEVNPGTIDTEKLIAYQQAGINRISIGIQSFNSKHLHSLNRIHDANTAVAAVNSAKTVGFTNINLDLMFGLPNQTVANALQDLTQAIKLQPQHISWYQLTVEPNTPFAKHPPPLPNEMLLWNMHTQGRKLLATHDFIQYEISAYARNKQYCYHNLNYWQFGDYLGIGPGAHSKITHFNGKIYRFNQPIKAETYINKFNDVTIYNLNENEQVLTSDDLIIEFMLNAMRLTTGFHLSLFEICTGLNRNLIATALNTAKSKNLITINNDHVCTTELGYKFLNQLLLEFV